MYPNIRAEMARKNITQGLLANEIHINVSTLSLKLQGKRPITVDEAKNIKRVLKSELTLEELFSTEVE